MAPSDQPTPAMPSTVLASVLHGPRDLRLQHRPIDPPGPGEVQVAIATTGLCGSDVAYYKHFANGDLCACMPLSLGHESAGIVVAVGPHVMSPLQPGDRVALEVGVSCGRCALCRSGRYNLCKAMRFRSSAKSVPHYQGTLQQRINHPAAWCHKLPDSVSMDGAALLEPLAVALHAVNRAGNLKPGSTALVIGAGTIGLLTAAVARSAGCAEVTITDVDAGRVQYALARGFATHGLVVPVKGAAPGSVPLSATNSVSASASDPDPTSGPSSGTSTPREPASGTTTPASIASSASSVPPASSAAADDDLTARLNAAKSLAAELQALTASEDASASASASASTSPDHAGFDVTFECTGKETCMHTGLYATKPGGKLVMVGMGTPVQTLPMSVAHLREIDIVGVFRYANTYAAGIRLLCSGRLPPLDDMVTHRFRGLAAAPAAFELASRTVDDAGAPVIKVVIEVA